MIERPPPPSASPPRCLLTKTLSVITGLGVIAILIISFYLVWLQYNSHQLWDIVSQHCVPEQRQQGAARSCLTVNLSQHYVVFNDANGPLHTLLIPTDKIAGIESAALLDSKAKNYFQQGWETRNLFLQQAISPVPERYLAQAINSRYGRTQNQLHLHLACLKPEIYQGILQQKNRINHQWKILPVALSGQHYLAIKIAATVNPFTALAQYVQAQGDKMDNYGLVSLAPDNGEIILLATRLQLTALNLGTTETLLDFDCKLAQMG